MIKIGEKWVENTVFFSEKTGLQIKFFHYNINIIMDCAGEYN